ncbi:MAG: peroxiredoxin, partial [Halobacteriales archaeon]|nr:peroxiredoxin [Halobacteriales archaeon]
ADTPGCTTEACSFRDNWAEYRDRDVAVVGISDDPVEDLKPFAEKFDIPFDLLSDEDGTVSSAYDSYGEKSMFGRTFDGVFRNTFVIDGDGVVQAIHRNVTPEGHAEAILTDVEELAA